MSKGKMYLSNVRIQHPNVCHLSALILWTRFYLQTDEYVHADRFSQSVQMRFRGTTEGRGREGRV
jgi:hypothetical protein